MTKKQKTYGLVLDLGGAGGWHSVHGLPFHPEIAAPVGTSVPGRSEVTLDQAKAGDKDPGGTMRLVELDEADWPELRDAVDAIKREQQGRDSEVPPHIGEKE